MKEFDRNPLIYEFLGPSFTGAKETLPYTGNWTAWLSDDGGIRVNKSELYDSDDPTGFLVAREPVSVTQLTSTFDVSGYVWSAFSFDENKIIIENQFGSSYNFSGSYPIIWSLPQFNPEITQLGVYCHYINNNQNISYRRIEDGFDVEYSGFDSSNFSKLFALKEVEGNPYKVSLLGKSEDNFIVLLSSLYEPVTTGLINNFNDEPTGEINFLNKIWALTYSPVIASGRLLNFSFSLLSDNFNSFSSGQISGDGNFNTFLEFQTTPDNFNSYSSGNIINLINGDFFNG